MLAVNPQHRPNCQQLLDSPVIQAKASQHLPDHLAQQHINYSQTHNELMKTIIFPKNLNFSKTTLPKAQYNQKAISMNDNSDPSHGRGRESLYSSQNTKDSSILSINKMQINKNLNQLNKQNTDNVKLKQQKSSIEARKRNEPNAVQTHVSIPN